MKLNNNIFIVNDCCRNCWKLLYIICISVLYFSIHIGLMCSCLNDKLLFEACYTEYSISTVCQKKESKKKQTPIILY